MGILGKVTAVPPRGLLWYIGRHVRQSVNKAFVLTLGRYTFSKIGKNVIFDSVPISLYPCADIQIGDSVRIGKRCTFQGNKESSIVIHNRVSINDGCFITSNHRIEIGEGTSIGEYTSIRDYNHTFKEVDVFIKDQGYEGSPIAIGRDCWIGRGCAVLPGVTIGDGSVVGANSVVTKSIPSFSIAVGSPARVVKKRGLLG